MVQRTPTVLLLGRGDFLENWLTQFKVAGYNVRQMQTYDRISRRKTFPEIVMHVHDGDFESEEMPFLTLGHVRKISPNTCTILKNIPEFMLDRAINSDIDLVTDDYNIGEIILRAKASANRRLGILNQVSSAAPKQRLLIIAAKLGDVAAALRGLRINSISAEVAELEYLALETQMMAEDPTSDDHSNSKIKEQSLKALPVIGKIFDTLDTVEGSKILIAGAVAGLLSVGGWPAVTAYSLCTAAWLGKDSFLQAVKGLAKQRGKGTGN